MGKIDPNGDEDESDGEDEDQNTEGACEDTDDDVDDVDQQKSPGEDGELADELYLPATDDENLNRYMI
jgi:hypothetical protein